MIRNGEVSNPFAETNNTTKNFAKYFSVTNLPPSKDPAH